MLVNQQEKQMNDENGQSLLLAITETRHTFQLAIRQMIADEIARRGQFAEQIEESLRNSPEITEEAFFIVLDELEMLTANLSLVLAQSGISKVNAQKWSAKTGAPSKEHRKNTLFMVIGYANEYFAQATIQHDLKRFVAEFSINQAIKPTAALFEKKLEELGFFDGLPARVVNPIINNGTKTLGELLVMTEAEFLRTPNVGHKILADLNAALEYQFGMKLGSLTRGQLKEYMDNLSTE